VNILYHQLLRLPLRVTRSAPVSVLGKIVRVFQKEGVDAEQIIRLRRGVFSPHLEFGNYVAETILFVPSQ